MGEILIGPFNERIKCPQAGLFQFADYFSMFWSCFAPPMPYSIIRDSSVAWDVWALKKVSFILCCCERAAHPPPPLCSVSTNAVNKVINIRVFGENKMSRMLPPPPPNASSASADSADSSAVFSFPSRSRTPSNSRNKGPNNHLKSGEIKRKNLPAEANNNSPWLSFACPVVVLPLRHPLPPFPCRPKPKAKFLLLIFSSSNLKIIRFVWGPTAESQSQECLRQGIVLSHSGNALEGQRRIKSCCGLFGAIPLKPSLNSGVTAV